MSTDIHGHLASGFEPVAEAFKENFSERGELGAGFTLIRDGEILVDIHAGHSDRKGEQPWTAETIVPVFSTGKAITALVVAWLVDQERLDYDAPVAEVWPEFAQAGKGEVTLAQALSHQAGLPGYPEEMEPSDWFDRELMESRFETLMRQLEATASSVRNLNGAVLASLDAATERLVAASAAETKQAAERVPEV